MGLAGMDTVSESVLQQQENTVFGRCPDLGENMKGI
jgi:hypothetical protein